MTKTYNARRLMTMIPLIGGFLLLLIVSFYFLWWHLPASVNRYGDIKKGNQLIERTESFAAENGLPETNDWATLQQLGYQLKGETLVPDYQKIDDTSFELMYLEGFDGPYLMWHSEERRWKMGYSTHFR